MNIYVYMSLHECIQGKLMKNISYNDLLYGHYVTSDKSNIIVKDLGLCPIFRIFNNFIVFLAMYNGVFDGSFDHLINEKKYIRECDLSIVGMPFSPIFIKGKEIEFKLIEYNEKTILKIYRMRNENNFYYEVFNGKVEVVYNGKIRKKKL